MQDSIKTPIYLITLLVEHFIVAYLLVLCSFLPSGLLIVMGSMKSAVFYLCDLWKKEIALVTNPYSRQFLPTGSV